MYLYGAGGHAKVIKDILSTCQIELSGIIDDNPMVQEWMGWKIIHQLQEGMSPILISIGSNAIRKKIAEKLSLRHVSFGKAIASTAIVSQEASIDTGSVVMQGSILQSGSRIGRHCIVNTGASIDHECVIEDYVHISPHATLCGNVHVGEGTWIGAGAVIVPGIRIGRWTTIGAGTVVIKDLPDRVVAVGNPCRIIRNIPENE